MDDEATEEEEGEGEGEVEGGRGEGAGRRPACLTPSPARHAGYVVDDLVAAERELAAEVRVSSIASSSSLRCDELAADFVTLQVCALCTPLHPSASHAPCTPIRIHILHPTPYTLRTPCSLCTLICTHTRCALLHRTPMIPSPCLSLTLCPYASYLPTHTLHSSSSVACWRQGGSSTPHRPSYST